MRKVTDAEEVTKLPCLYEFMSQLECQAWMNIELKKDFIEQDLAQKANIPPLGGLRKVDVYQQVIRNRLTLKGKLTLQYLKEKMSQFWSKNRQSKIVKNVDFI